MRPSPKLLTGLLVAASAIAATPAAAEPGPPIDLSRASTCDFIGEQQGSLCLLPFPNDYYTVRDKKSRTGRRVHLQDASMPANTAGQPISAAPYNFNDGFSPGQVTTLRVAGLDNPQALAATNPVGLADLGAYKRKKAPVVVIDAKTGKRWPIWVEIDSNGETPETMALLIHPARNYDAKHRYIVALRRLRTSTGATIPAPDGFRYYRDRLDSGEAVINKRRKHFERIFKTLGEAGIARKNLYLAWDFTVASDQNIAERELFMRDDAFRQLGDRKLDDLKVKGASPSFVVGTVTEFSPCGADGCQSGEDLNIQRRVQGTYTVPCYLQPNCDPGGRFALDGKGLPSQNGTYEAKFDCIIPRATPDVAGAAAANRPSLYGHGLLGDASEVTLNPQKTLAQAHGFVFCGTDTIGFSENDVPNIVGILQNLGDFPELTDRVQQGMLNTLYLGRMMIHPQGLSSNPAFHVDPNTASPSTIKTKRLYYNGNSQGGILGGAITAVAPDFTRASLGVPAMNYSVLLQRSVDYDLYSQILDPFYPSPMTQGLGLSLIQMLWDRSEANGYAHRMTVKSLPNTPSHEVLMNVAFGDHQVTTWQADVEARTIGARTHKPVVYPGRWPGVKPLWGIPRIGKYPYEGSAIVYWDNGPPRPDSSDPGDVVGTGAPPIENLPNRSGADPHSGPRNAAGEQQMVSDFLQPNKKSQITNTCKPLACFAGGFLGP